MRGYLEGLRSALSNYMCFSCVLFKDWTVEIRFGNEVAYGDVKCRFLLESYGRIVSIL